MFARNRRQEADPEIAKRKLDSFVHDLAAGRPTEDLSIEEVWILGAEDGCANDRLPLDVAETLGFKPGPGTTCGGLVMESLTEAHAQERVSQMTNSREVVAIQIPKMGDIVKVVKSGDGLGSRV